jgi:hypothetical protein
MVSIHLGPIVPEVPVFSRVRAINAGKIASISDIAAAFGEGVCFCQIESVRFHSLAFKVIDDSLPQLARGDIPVMYGATGNAGFRQFSGQQPFSQTLIVRIHKNIRVLIALYEIEIIGVDITKISRYRATAAWGYVPARLELDGSPGLDTVLGLLNIVGHDYCSPLEPRISYPQFLGS